MADQLTVELVAADRIVWSGEARQINARTVDGELGVLRGHIPLLSLLAPSAVEIVPVDGAHVVAAVDSGFISVANDRVSILAEHAQLADEVDLEQAQADLEAGAADEDGTPGTSWAEARISAVEKTRGR